MRLMISLRTRVRGAGIHVFSSLPQQFNVTGRHASIYFAFETLVLMPRIWEMPGSNLDKRPTRFTEVFRGIPQYLQENVGIIAQNWKRPIPDGGMTFPYFTASRLALGSTQLSIQWVSGALPQSVKRTKCEATTNKLFTRHYLLKIADSANYV
jgi:hypothetical protein